MACQFKNLYEESIAENLLFFFTKGPSGGEFINIRQTLRNKDGKTIYLKAGMTFPYEHVDQILTINNATKAAGKNVWNTIAEDGTVYNYITLDPCYKLFCVKKHHHIATSIYLLNEEWEHIINLLDHLNKKSLN